MSKYHFNTEYFHNIDTEEKAYFLGLLAADGNVLKIGGTYRVTLALQEKDKAILDRFNMALDYDRPLTVRKPNCDDGSNRKTQFILLIHSGKMGADLIKHGVVPRKTFSLNFLSTLSDHLIRPYLLGYSDGDGWICLSKGDIQWGLCAPESFCKSVCDLFFLTTGGRGSMQPCGKGDHNVKEIAFGGRHQVYKWLKWLYCGATVFLERKYQKYTQAVSDYEKRYVINKDGSIGYTELGRSRFAKYWKGKHFPQSVVDKVKKTRRAGARKFICLNNGDEFYMPIDAARKYSLRLGSVNECLHRKISSARGFYFEFADKINGRANEDIIKEIDQGRTTAGTSANRYRKIIEIKTGLIFNMIKDVTQKTGENHSTVYYHLRKAKDKTLFGFMYLDEYQKTHAKEMTNV